MKVTEGISFLISLAPELCGQLYGDFSVPEIADKVQPWRTFWTRLKPT